MATCKDCVHYEVCDTYMPTDCDTEEVLEMCAKGKSDEITDIENICNSFKSNSHYVEIPCYCKECRYSYWEKESENSSAFKCGNPNGLFDEIDFTDYCSYGERQGNK